MRQGCYIMGGNVVQKRPEDGGFGRKPAFIADDRSDLLLRKSCPHPGHGFGIAEFQDTSDCVFRVSGRIESLNVDIPEKRN